MSDSLDLGPCCACGATDNVRNFMMLGFRTPQPGTGWGCLACRLPSDGAVAVLCDECLAANRRPTQYVLGYVTEQRRAPIEQLTEPFEHDDRFHPELQRKCRVCGCDELHACFDAERGPCSWVEENLCSHCVQRSAGEM